MINSNTSKTAPATLDPDVASREKYVKLPQGMRDWLNSDDVFNIIHELNDNLQTFSSERTVISRLITQVALQATPPSDFTKKLSEYLPVLSDKQVLDTATAIHDRIFKPLKNIFRSSGIDIESIATPLQTTPAAHTMKINRAAITKTITPAAPAAKVVMPARTAPAPTAQPEQPHARVMEMAQVIDLRRPMKATIKPEVAQKPAEQPKTNAASQTMKMEGGGSFAAGAARGNVIAPRTEKTSTAPSKTPTEKADMLEAEKPFGLAETLPKPPTPAEQPPAPKTPAAPAPTKPAPPTAAAAPEEHHDIAPYHDEHPVVE